MNRLSPSMLSIDFGHMEESLRRVWNTGTEMIHVDVMDGAFVPNISFGAPVMRYVRKALPDAVLDVHMMVEEPTRYLQDFKAAGADIFTIHAEAVKHLNRAVAEVHDAGLRCGVALNPATSPEVLRYVLRDIDMVLIMSVNPGFGGQKFLRLALDKIRAVRAMEEELGTRADIEVDGGINLENVDAVLDAGASVIVAGSAVFGGNIEQNIAAFQQHLRAGEEA